MKVVGIDLIFLLALLSHNSDKWLGGNHHISAADSGFSVCDNSCFCVILKCFTYRLWPKIYGEFCSIYLHISIEC
jgi:hypothetical protein